MFWNLRTKILLGFGISWITILLCGIIGYYITIQLKMPPWLVESVILITLLTLGITIVGGISLAIRIHRSMQSLLSGVQHLAAGNLEYRVPISTHDEIATLTKAFNEMAQRLQITQSDLGKSMALFQSLFEASPDAILVINSQDYIVHANPQAEKLFGYSQQELQNRPFENLFSEHKRDSRNHPLQAFHLDPKPIPLGTNPDLFILTRTGIELPVDIQLGLVTRDGAPLILCVLRDISVQKQAEAELRTRAEQVHDLYNQAPCGYHSLDVNGVFLAINDTELQWLGYQREELIEHKAITDILTPESQHIFQETFPLLKENGFLQDMELDLLRADGTILPMLVNATAVYDESGQFVMSHVSSFDHTALKKAREALQKANEELEQRVQVRTTELAYSEKAYRQMADNALLGVYQSTVGGKVLYANPAITKIFGFASVEDVMRHPTHFRYKNPQIRTELLETLEEKGRIQDIEIEMLTLQGEEITVLANMTLDGEILSGMLLDITARKQAEEALRNSETRLHLALTASYMGVWEWDIETNAVYWSPECYVITGISDFDGTLEGFLKNAHPEDVPLIKSALQKTISEGSVFALEFRFLRPGYAPIWLSNFGVMQYNETDRPTSLIGTIKDITERKNTEAQVRAYAQRTAFLSEASRVFAEASLDYTDVITQVVQYTAETLGDLCILREFSNSEILEDQVVFYDRAPNIREIFQTMLANLPNSEELSLLGIETAHTGQPLLLTETDMEQYQDSIPTKYWPLQMRIGFKGMIIVPINYRRKVMGLLYLIRHQNFLPPYTNEDVSLTQELTDRAALAIANARLFQLVQKELVEKASAEEKIRQLNAHLEQRIATRTQELRTALAKTKTLYTIASATVAFDNLTEALEQVVEGVAQGLPAHRVILLTFDHTEQKVTHLVRGGPGAAEHTPNLTYTDWMDGLTGWVMREGKATLSLKEQPDPREGQGAQHRRVKTHVGSIAIAPLRFLEQILGTLTAIRHTDEENYTDADLELLKAMANQTAALLVRANLLESLRLSNQGLQAEIAERAQLEIHIRHSEARANALADVSKILTEARPEEQPFIGRIAQQLADLLGDICNLNLISKDNKSLQAPAFYHPAPKRHALIQNLLRIAPYYLGEGLAGKVAQTGIPILLSNVPSNLMRQEIDPSFLPYLDQFGISSICIVSMHARDHIVGTLGVIREKPGHPYTLEDQFFLQDVADRVGLAVENSHLFLEANAAREEANQANLAKSEFLSRMSHELRTPLNAILGFAQLLSMDVLNNSQNTAVHHVLQAGRHLLSLINEVLDITRIESGQLSLSPEPVLLNSVVREAIEMTQPQANAHQIRLELNCPDFIYAKVDRQRLKQVLLNILTNAIKYNREGGQIWVECKTLSETHVQLRTRDTGNGMSLEQQKRLFVPFERLGAERTTVEGTGLGLALSQHLVQAMGGTIGVESELGVGSTFWINLLAAENPVEQSYHPEDGVILIPPASGDFPSHTVLYIEDNLSNLQLVEEIFKLRPTIRLLAVLDGKTGLDIAIRKQPDLILLDLNLPDITGDEVVQYLKANARTQHIPLIIVSADATPHHIQALRQAGIYNYLTKPLDIATFLQQVDAILENTISHPEKREE